MPSTTHRRRQDLPAVGIWPTIGLLRTDDKRTRLATLATLALAVLAVLAVYGPGSVLTGHQVLLGADDVDLHARRMTFAREALWGAQHGLPGWYPRELLGTPFWSNTQNFPFLPTRLAVFLAFQPDVAFSAGVILAAVLALIFTWLFARRVGMSALAAAVAGFTFACCGCYAARVLAGHLPLLEVFPSLPLLLWLTDRVVREPGLTSPAAPWKSLLVLALASGCLALAGHPQLVIYALATATAYAWVMGSRRRAAMASLASLLGVGCASVVLLPMLLLAGRSTRVLDLGPASNDVAMPYGRLLSFFLPWRDGWASIVRRGPWQPFRGYPNITYFWDTFVYLGWLPWLALCGLALLQLRRRQWPERQGLFWVAAGSTAFAMSLPFWQALMHQIPGTFLRSPARLMYLVTFCLAMAAGAGLDRLARLLSGRARRWGGIAVAVLIVVHVADLATHARAFLSPRNRTGQPSPAETANLQRMVGEGRVGIDYSLDSPHNRKWDDVGFFDSFALARPYRFVIDTSGLPERRNEQQIDAWEMRPRTLTAAGVRLVVTMKERSDLHLLQAFADGLRMYRVDGAADRARFYRLDEVEFADESRTHARLRDPSADLDARLWLKPAFREPIAAAPAEVSGTPVVLYRRLSSDAIAVAIASPEPGYLRVLESWDPGWQSTLDGHPVRTLAGNDTFLSVAVPAGRHVVTFEFFTPGLAAGMALSLACAVLLVLLLLGSARWLGRYRPVAQVQSPRYSNPGEPRCPRR